MSNNSPDGPEAVIDGVAAVEAVAAASATNAAGRFGPATQEVGPVGSPTPMKTSSVPGQHEAAEAAGEEVEVAAVATDDQPEAVGSGSCHKAPAGKPVAFNTHAYSHIAVRVRTHHYTCNLYTPQVHVFELSAIE